MDHGPGHRLLQSLVPLETRGVEGKVYHHPRHSVTYPPPSPPAEDESASFAAMLFKHLREHGNLAEYAAGNRSAFVLCELTHNMEVGAAARKAVQPHLPEEPAQAGAIRLVAVRETGEVGVESVLK